MIAKGTGYVRGNREAAEARLTAHFKYIEHRHREENETRDDRRIFNSTKDVVNRGNAIEDVMSHTSTSVNYHKIVLSPDQGEQVTDWREWTRGVMDDLEKKQGRELHWYAVKHDNTDNPHVHVVLAGAGENHETGKLEAVKMYQKDYELLRQSGTDRSDRDWYQRLEEHVKGEDRHDQQEIARTREPEQAMQLPPSGAAQLARALFSDEPTRPRHDDQEYSQGGDHDR
jgi:hypothetical protein